MRTSLAVILALAAAACCIEGAGPAVAGEQFSVPDYRSNFVYRPWWNRHAYRFTWYDSHHTVILWPRNHFRLRRQGIDLQLRDRWVAHVEPHVEALK
jgi:hypothetical protein